MVFMQICQNYYTLFDMTISCSSDTFKKEVIKEERRWIERENLNEFFAGPTETKVEIILGLLLVIS